jgi:hypothetical protein
MGKASSKDIPMAVENNDYRKKVTFDFDKAGKGFLELPDNFDQLVVGDDVTVTIEGKITQVRKDEEGASFTVKGEELELSFENKCSMKGAMDDMAEKRRK